MYERWARGVFPASFIDPDVERSRIGADTPALEGEWRGVEGLSRAMAEYLNAFSDLRIEAESIIDLDDDRVLVLSRQTARGKLQRRAHRPRGRRSVHAARRQGGALCLLVGSCRRYARRRIVRVASTTAASAVRAAVKTPRDR